MVPSASAEGCYEPSNIFAFDATTGRPRHGSFDNGRIYNTLRGGDAPLRPLLHPGERDRGRETFVASGAGDGRNWSTVNGMTLASGRLYDATAHGNLPAVDLTGGPPSGSASVVSGPLVDGETWQSRDLIVVTS
jgi:hypothetical protein